MSFEEYLAAAEQRARAAARAADEARRAAATEAQRLQSVVDGANARVREAAEVLRKRGPEPLRVYKQCTDHWSTRARVSGSAIGEGWRLGTSLTILTTDGLLLQGHEACAAFKRVVLCACMSVNKSNGSLRSGPGVHGFSTISEQTGSEPDLSRDVFRKQHDAYPETEYFRPWLADAVQRVTSPEPL